MIRASELLCACVNHGALAPWLISELPINCLRVCVCVRVRARAWPLQFGHRLYSMYIGAVGLGKIEITVLINS